jgi:hypothetical protein
MTRRAWTVVIVVVAVIVAAVAGTAVIAATHHRSETVWPRATLGVQSGQSGWQQGDGPGSNGGYGRNGQNGTDGQGYGWGGNGMGPRLGGEMMDRGAWQPLRGIPWLVLGLLIGAGVTVLVWQPWKRPAAAAAGAAGAGAAGGAQGTADQWAQWHRELHAADEATTQPIATAGAAPEPDAPAEPDTPA